MNRLNRGGNPDAPLVASVTGSGPGALVLLHGYPFDHTMWLPQLRDLESRARLLAPDLRGLGKSGGEGDAGSMRIHADDVIAWMDEAKIEKAAVAGLSMGGYVAFELWRRAPSRISGLALLDTAPHADSPAAAEARAQSSETIRAGGMEAVVDGMLARVLGKTTRATRHAVVEQLRRMILATKPEGARAALAALRTRPSSVADLGGISVPVVIVVGDEDEVTPVATSQEMAAAIPRSELRVLKGAGHVTSLEAPQEVTRALEDLLKRVEGR